jgi:hypothetical protein
LPGYENQYEEGAVAINLSAGAIMVFYMGVWHWTGQDNLAQVLVLATAATARLIIWMFQSLAKRKSAPVKAKC